MKVIVFDTHPFERDFLEAALSRHHPIQCVEVKAKIFN